MQEILCVRKTQMKKYHLLAKQQDCGILLGVLVTF